MKNNILTFSVLCLLCMFTACNNKSGNEKAAEGDVKAKDSETPAETVNNQISFTADGQTVLTSGYNIGRFVKNNQRGIRIMSNMYQKPQAINIDISSIAPGTYKFVSGKSSGKDSASAYGSYFPNYAKDMNNNYYFESGEFIISSIDTLKGVVNGSFSGKATNTKKQTITITDGKVINGKIEPVVYKY